MDTLTLASWSGLVGIFLPLLIAVINRLTWTKPFKALFALFICLVAGLGTVYFSGNFSLTNLSVSMGAILIATWASFSTFWQQIGVTQAIEKATNPPVNTTPNSG